MSSHDYKSAVRPDPDAPLVAIAEYATGYRIESAQAYETARYMEIGRASCRERV